MRVNIESELFSDTRLRKFARLMKWTEPHSAGVLLFIWFHSQSNNYEFATEDEILEWCHLDGQEEVIDELVRARFLVPHPPKTEGEKTKYEIVGNKKQIENRAKWLDKSRKGGKARALKAKRNSDGSYRKVRHSGITDPAMAGDLPAKHQPTSSQAPANAQPRSQPNPGQYNSIQSNTIQSNTTQKGEHSSPKEIAGTLSIPKSWQSKINEFDRGMGARWFVRAKQKLPNGRFNEDKFVLAIAKMRGNFDLDEKQIEFIFDWVEQDEFWCRNAISPDSLLKKSKSNPDITKLEQVVMALHHRKKSRTEKEIEAVQKVSKKYDSPSKALSVFLEAAK